MTISDKTRKILWAKSGNRCCLCKQELVQQAVDGGAHFIIGDECHIYPQSADGPRAQGVHESEDTHAYANLILLCKNHHKEVDDCPAKFPAEVLLQIKADHERWVAATLGGQGAPLLSGLQIQLLSEIQSCDKAKVKGISLLMMDSVMGAYVPYLWNNHLHGGLRPNMDDMTDVIAAVDELVEMGFLKFHDQSGHLIQYRVTNKGIPAYLVQALG